jgi:adenylylsulfate kinase
MKPMVVWFTGLPAAGKTTMAERVRDRLAAAGLHAELLDSDALRPLLAPERGYRDADRTEFYLRLAELAAVLARRGEIVLVAATAPLRAHRQTARELAPRFAEVFLEVPVTDCEQRDIKGLYARARAGSAPDLPGVGAPYEPPEHPDVVARGGRDQGAIDAVVRLVERGVSDTQQRAT